MRSFLLAIVLVATEAHAGTVFIPAVSANARPLLSSADSRGSVWRETYWQTSHTLTNPTDYALTFRYLRVFGDHLAQISFACSGSLSIPSNYSWEPKCLNPGAGPAFVELDLDPGLILTGSIHFTAAIGCGPPMVLPTPIATAPLPVYEALFPAGSTAVSADLPPTGTFVPDELCPEPSILPSERHVNLTVFNAGHEPATAEVRAVGVATPPLRLSLAAGEVVQVNGVSANNVLLVTSSQPFLCYASSVTTWPDPSRVPDIAVYPFRALP